MDDVRWQRGDRVGHKRFLDYIHGQIRELMTNYGKIDLLFYDIPAPYDLPEEWKAREMNAMVKRLQPGILIAFLAGGLDRADAFFNAWSSAHNPFFNGPLEDVLSMIPFVLLTGFLYLVAREKLLGAKKVPAGNAS